MTWGSSRRLLAPDANWLFQPQIIHFLFGTKKNLTQAQIIHVRHPFFVKEYLWQLCDLHLASEERTSAERLQCLQWAGIWNITTTRLPGHGTQAHFPKKPVDWCRLGQVRHHNPSVSNVGCAIAPAMVLSSSKFAHRNSWIFMVHSYQGSSRVTPIWNRMGARWSLSVVGHRLSEVKIHGKYWQDVFRWCAWAVNGHDGHVRLYPSNVFPADFHSPNLILT